MVGRLVFLALLIVPIIEIALFILIGQAIGVWPTIASILLIALIGSAIIRRQGLRLLAEIRETMGEGRLPARAVADAMLVAIAGVLMVVPGYFTDALGLVLLIPPLRHWFYRWLSRRMGLVGTGPDQPAPTATTGPRVIELDPEQFRPR